MARKINLEENKTSVPVRNLVKAINKNISSQMKDSDIPAFMVVASDISLERYFMNHDDLNAIYGTNIGLIDRMVLHAINEYMTKDIYDAMDKAIPGTWDKFTIYNIIAATITIMKHDTLPKLYFTDYQYVQISEEDLATLQNDRYMEFSEYNPNRFMQVYLHIRTNVINTIAGIIESKIPTAFLANTKEELNVNLIETYKEFMKTDLVKILEEYKDSSKDILPELQDDLLSHYLNHLTSERDIRKFVDHFESPFLVYLTTMLKNSGFNENVVNIMLGVTKIHIIYDDPGKSNKKIGDINIVYRMQTTEMEPTFTIQISLSIKQIMNFALMTDYTELSKSQRDNFAKAIRGFILKCCTYCTSIYNTVAAINFKTNETDEEENEIDDIVSDLLESDV